jgi:hypothetical protein
MAVLGKASGYSSGIRIRTARIVPFNTNVPIIQYLDLVLICPPDSIIDVSNMSSLVPFEEELFYLDTAPFQFVPGMERQLKKSAMP